MNIPIIINNRDLLTWPKAMVEKCRTLDYVGDIVIVDNGSTYPPLLEWYDTNPCEIVRCENIGHQAPWISGTVAKYANPYYVVTDPDLGIDDLPSDTLTILREKLERNPRIGKVGLGLDWRSVKSSSPYFGHMMTYERPRWLSSRMADGIYIDVAIDTTFALYNIDKYFIGGGSLDNPYVAEHYPWYYNEKERIADDEFMYYLRNANQSASYVSFLGLKFHRLTDLQATNPELYNTDKFGISDKFATHSYGPFYDELFKKNDHHSNQNDDLAAFHDHERLKILEVGTYKGGFLRLIHDYYPKAEIHGIDVHPLWIPNPAYGRIKFIHANAYDMGSYDGTKYDVIIDDGPHTLDSQIYALRNFPSLLYPGGTLVIEDVLLSNLDHLISASPDRSKIKVYDFTGESKMNDDIIITLTR